MHVIRVPISAPTYGSVNGRSMTQRLGARFRGACSMAKKYNHLGVTRPVRKCCPLCPGKRTYLPILERLPPPALHECRHRGLARRSIAVRGACDFSWISRLAKDQQQQQPQALPNTDHGKAAQFSDAVVAPFRSVERALDCVNHRKIELE